MNEVMSGQEIPGQTPEFLYVLDLDRTLIDSRVTADALYAAAEEQGILRSELEALEKQADDASQPFDVVEAVTRQLPADLPPEEIENRLETIKARFLELVDRNELLYEGAEQLISQLESEDIYIPFVIATYGGEMWQEWKLEAAGFKEKDYIITSTEEEKGAWIARDWLQPDGTYAPPYKEEEHRERLKAKHVVIVDDKRKSFEGAPPGTVTILVRHRGVPVRQTQDEGDFNPDITVGGIGDVIATLNMPNRREGESES